MKINNNNNNINQLGSGFLAIGSPKSSCFKSASPRNSGSPPKVHWEKSLSPSASSSSTSSSSSSSESIKMASPALSSSSPSSNHRPPHQRRCSPSSPRPIIDVPNSRAAATTDGSKPSPLSPPPPPSAQISSRTRQSSSSSYCSSSSSSSPSPSTSPSFAGAKWQADPPLPGAVPKPPTRWLGPATAAENPGDTPSQQLRQQLQQQQQRPLWQPLATRPAAKAAFPTEMRSGCDASEIRALMAPPPPPSHLLPTSTSSSFVASIDDAADFQMRADISNRLKALLNVA